MEFNSIGYFQFDNLLQTRTPFLLVLLEQVDVSTWYNSLVKMHLQNITIQCNAETAVAAVQERNLPPHFAVVVLDNEATLAPQVVNALEKAGFLNAFFIKDGFQGLLKERQA